MRLDFPNDDKSIAENCTLLILAGPRLDTQRELLARIARPAVRSCPDAEPAGGPFPRRPGLATTPCGLAADQAKVEPARIGRVIHDAGSGLPPASGIGHFGGDAERSAARTRLPEGRLPTPPSPWRHGRRQRRHQPSRRCLDLKEYLEGQWNGMDRHKWNGPASKMDLTMIICPMEHLESA